MDIQFNGPIASTLSFADIKSNVWSAVLKYACDKITAEIHTHIVIYTLASKTLQSPKTVLPLPGPVDPDEHNSTAASLIASTCTGLQTIKQC